MHELIDSRDDVVALKLSRTINGDDLNAIMDRTDDKRNIRYSHAVVADMCGDNIRRQGDERFLVIHLQLRSGFDTKFLQHDMHACPRRFKPAIGCQPIPLDRSGQS